MKTYKLLVIITLIFFSSSCCSQEEKCNQQVSTKWLKNKIPNSVCIPNNQHIREIKSKKDINKDKLNDFIITHSKINAKDRDTLFVSIYTQNTDSTYSLKKTLGNLYPIILNDYNSDLYINDSLSGVFVTGYNGIYPLKKLEFLEEEVVLKINIGAGETMVFHFIYRNTEDNWFLEWAEYRGELTRQAEELLRADGVLNEFKPTIEKIYYSNEEQIPIDEFDYFDWI